MKESTACGTLSMCMSCPKGGCAKAGELEDVLWVWVWVWLWVSMSVAGNLSCAVQSSKVVMKIGKSNEDYIRLLVRDTHTLKPHQHNHFA